MRTGDRLREERIKNKWSCQESNLGIIHSESELSEGSASIASRQGYSLPLAYKTNMIFWSKKYLNMPVFFFKYDKKRKRERNISFCYIFDIGVVSY